jgi:hypothetical protein
VIQLVYLHGAWQRLFEMLLTLTHGLGASPSPDKHAQMSNVPTKLDNKYKETKAAELLRHHANTTAGIIGMGAVLTEVRRALPPREFTEWIRRHCRFSNATSLRYRRSFAFATSIDDFASLQLETMALYFCADLYAKLRKPIEDSNDRTAMEAGLQATLKAARKHLIDGDEALAIYDEVRQAKFADLTKAMPAVSNLASTDEPPAMLAASEPKETAPNSCNDPIIVETAKKILIHLSTLDEHERKAFMLNLSRVHAQSPAPLQFPTALHIVIREQSDSEWLTEIENIGEIHFRRHFDHMSALISKLNARNGAVKVKADRAEAKAKNKS